MADTTTAPLFLAAFSVCPTCGASVCARLWHHPNDPKAYPWWEELAQPVSPILGTTHLCVEECSA